MIHSQPLRQTLLSLLVELPELNTTDHSGQVWCNLKVERLNCMLTHCRKLQREPSCLTAVAGKLTRLQYQALMEGLKKLKLSNEDQLGKAPANKKLGKAHAAQEDLLGKAGASKRQLVPRDSDVEGGKGGKMHLIVEISAKMTPHYKALIGKIREALEKDNLTKEEALSMRAKLLEQYGS